MKKLPDKFTKKIGWRWVFSNWHPKIKDIIILKNVPRWVKFRYKLYSDEVRIASFYLKDYTFVGSIFYLKSTKRILEAGICKTSWDMKNWLLDKGYLSVDDLTENGGIK